MTEKEIISSGLLEGYVTGSISSEEIAEVEKAIDQFPEVKKEVEEIELALIKLSESAAGNISSTIWERISDAIFKVKTLPKAEHKSRSMSSVIGWAAAVICFLGLAWMLKQNNDLKRELRVTSTENVILKDKVNTNEIDLAEANNLLEVIRSQEYETISLPGNADVAPDAYATVYYNKDTKTAYIDANGLPTPPRGKVYQAWSLIMEPLTPSDIGLLSGFEDHKTRFFKLENIPSPEAFGITLEPEGGSKTPTLSQLYAIGTLGQ